MEQSYILDEFHFIEQLDKARLVLPKKAEKQASKRSNCKLTVSQNITQEYLYK